MHKLQKTFCGLFILMFLSCEHYCEPAIFLLPDNYKGPFWVVFDQKTGLDKEYESDKRVYRIPETGILFSKFKPEFGVIHEEYFYITSEFKRIKLYEISTIYFRNGERDYKYNIKPSRTGFYILNNGTAGVCGSGDSEIRWLFAFAGTFNEFEEYTKQGSPIIGVCDIVRNGL